MARYCRQYSTSNQSRLALQKKFVAGFGGPADDLPHWRKKFVLPSVSELPNIVPFTTCSRLPAQIAVDESASDVTWPSALRTAANMTCVSMLRPTQRTLVCTACVVSMLLISNRIVSEIGRASCRERVECAVVGLSCVD